MLSALLIILNCVKLKLRMQSLFMGWNTNVCMYRVLQKFCLPPPRLGKSFMYERQTYINKQTFFFMQDINVSIEYNATNHQ